ATLGAMAPTRQVPRFIPQLASGRLLVALGAGLLVGLGLPGTLVALRIVAAWNAFAWVLLTLAWIFIWRADAAETRRHAAGEDPGRRTVWVVATLSSTFSLFAAVFVLRQAHRLAPDHAVLWVGLCLVAVVASWLLTHTAWALRYAHLYYRDDDE